MTTETTIEFKFCSGCRLPGCMLRQLILMQHGYICHACVNAATAQMMLAMRVERELERVHCVLAHIQDLAMPRLPRLWMESDVSRLDALASELDKVARDYAHRTGTFVERGETTSTSAAPVVEPPTTAAPALRLAQPPDVPAQPTAGPAADSQVYAIICDILNAELADWPTLRMRESLAQNGVDDEPARLGLREMLDELGGHCEFLDSRPQLTLVRVPADGLSTTELGAPVAPPSSSAASDQPGPNAVLDDTSLSVDSRAWIERLQAWMTSLNLSPEELARRAKRDRATVAGLLGRQDRQTSLRLFLDLVRNAGARLSGVHDSTPRGLFRRLKELLSRQGLSITTLARKSGIHRTQLSTLFNKSNPNPCLLTVQRIIAVLDAETEVNLVEIEQGRAALGGAEA